MTEQNDLIEIIERGSIRIVYDGTWYYKMVFDFGCIWVGRQYEYGLLETAEVGLVMDNLNSLDSSGAIEIWCPEGTLTKDFDPREYCRSYIMEALL